jgi:hypothetical protein
MDVPFGWNQPKLATCMKVAADKMPSGLCGSMFIVFATYPPKILIFRIRKQTKKERI